MTTAVADIQQAICTLIVDELEWNGDADRLVGNDPLGLPEILDSAALLELASAIETDYDIEIDDAEITAVTFANVASLAELVDAKVQAGA